MATISQPYPIPLFGGWLPAGSLYLVLSELGQEPGLAATIPSLSILPGFDGGKTSAAPAVVKSINVERYKYNLTYHGT